MVRSPDGESRGFALGAMSVQMAAAAVLDKYYTEFPVHNPYLDRYVTTSQQACLSTGSVSRIQLRKWKDYVCCLRDVLETKKPVLNFEISRPIVVSSVICKSM